MSDKPSQASPPHARPGLSYVEVLAAAVLMSILLVASMKLFGNLGRSRLHTIDRDAACQLAVDILEEIKHLSYRDPADPEEFGPGADEQVDGSRLRFDDIDDYHNWTAGPPQSHNGQPLTQFARLTRTVTTRYVSPDDFTVEAGEDEGFLAITVTISDSDHTIESQEYVIANIDNL